MSKPKILIVDDTLWNIKLLTNVLKEDYRLSVANNGSEALSLLSREELPDLVLLDIMMPDMDGYEVCRRIKENPAISHIPVVFITAMTEVEDEKKGFEAGAVDYITKPFSLPIVIARVKTHIQLKIYKDALVKERNELKKRNDIIEHDLDMARRLQSQLIPSSSPIPQIAYFYKPMEKVGGDLFDFVPFDDGKIGIFLSDVSGHGVPAALITSMVKSIITQIDRTHPSPSELLTTLNGSIYGLIDDNFITAFFGIYNPNTHEFVFSNAGHNHPYIISEAGLSQIKPTSKGMPLGIMNNDYYKKRGLVYSDESIILPSNSKLLLYTDGLTETVHTQESVDNTHNADFEHTKIDEVLVKYKSSPSEAFVSNIIKELEIFRGSDIFEDDVCVICVDVP